MTASSIRSAWEKLSAITCSARIESGLLVMLPSEVNADPIRVPMATTEAGRTRPQAARTRHGCTAGDRASRWVIDVRLACASCPSRSFERVADMSSFLSLVQIRAGWLGRVGVGALGGDPGGEDVVGVVGQVVADQGVEQVGVVVEVGGGDARRAAGPGCRGGVPRPGRGTRGSAGSVGDERGRHEQRGGVVRLGQVEDLAGGRVVAADQPAEQDLDVDGACAHCARWALTIR